MNREKFKLDFIGIGLERSATTWIFECIKEHRQICCSKYKEVKFFSQKTQFEGEDDKYSRGLKYYQSYFKHCQSNQIKGEFSPHYFFEKKSADRIKKHFSNVKLILCLRNPIDRIYSFYWYEKTRGKIPYNSFEETINSEKFSYLIKEGYYFEYLQYYLRLFPKENILILLYEDIAKNPIKFLQTIFKFLKVDPNFIPSKTSQFINNPDTKNKFQLFIAKILLKIKKLLTKSNLGRSFINFMERIGFENFVNIVLEKKKNKKSPRPPIKPKTKKYLQNLYQEDFNKVKKIIDRYDLKKIS